MSDEMAKRSADALMSRWQNNSATTAEMRSSADRMKATGMMSAATHDIIKARLFLIDHPNR